MRVPLDQSGAVAAARKRYDIVAACFFALITATGGGTLRDLLLGVPVFWMVAAAPEGTVVTLPIWMVAETPSFPRSHPDRQHRAPT